jgi:hypothetical protein
VVTERGAASNPHAPGSGAWFTTHVAVTAPASRGSETVPFSPVELARKVREVLDRR